MVRELGFGPFADDENAFSAAKSAGFPLLFSDNFLRVKIEDDGFVDEDWATVWRVDNTETSIFVCALLVEGEERTFPGSEPASNVREYEKRWRWPTWTSQSWVISKPVPQLPHLDDDILCAMFQQSARYELTLEREILGLGRTGDVKLFVRSPPSAKALAAVNDLIRNSCLPDMDN